MNLISDFAVPYLTVIIGIAWCAAVTGSIVFVIVLVADCLSDDAKGDD